MKFIANFYSNCGSAIGMKSKNVGLIFLRRAREATIPNLASDRVRSKVNGFFLSPSIELTEEEAERTGLFEDNCDISIIVPPQSLNRFVSIQPDISQDNSTGEITEVRPVPEVDKEGLKQAWLTAGAPLKWRPGS